MKIGVVLVYYQTEDAERKRIKKEFSHLIPSASFYEIDNTSLNIGFGAGVNKAVKKALKDRCDVLIIANSDISLVGIDKKFFLEGLKNCDVLGFCMREGDTVYSGGEIDRVRMSGGLLLGKIENGEWRIENGSPVEAHKFAKSGELKIENEAVWIPDTMSTRFGNDEPSSKILKIRNSKLRTALVIPDFVSGSLMIVKRDVFEKIGLFREDYFLYYEDVEFCQRAKKAGFKIGVDSHICYKHNSSSNENVKKDWFLAKNRLKFALEYGGTKQIINEIVYSPKTLVSFLKAGLKRSPFFKNFGILNLTSFLGKALNFLLFFVLVRFLSVKDYGIYTLVWTQVGLLNPFLDLGTTTYTITQESSKALSQVPALISLRLLIGFITMFLTVGIALFVPISHNILFYIALISTTLFANSVSGSYLIVQSLKKQSSKAALLSLMFQVLLTGTSILLLIGHKGLYGIFGAVSIGYLLYGLCILFLLYKEFNHENSWFEMTTWKSILRHSFVFVLISFFAGLYYKIDIVLLKYFNLN
ncbi:MAG: oligosaccharide flippase family protein [Candidatus Roizmanbacteria bacterium]